MMNSRILFRLMLTALLPGSAGLFAASGDTPSAKVILKKALERAEWAEERNIAGRYRFQFLSVNEKLDGDGRVREEEKRLYESIPIQGAPFERLLEIDGRPLTEKEQRKEEKREAEFRKKLAKGKSGEPDEKNRMRFDEELTGRYRFEVESRQALEGRDCWVLAFEPRPGELPVKRRIDHALNKSAGRIWVDAETHEISRVEFRLIDKVRLWWGMIGSISQLEGRIDRSRIAQGAWMPSEVEFYLKGRIFFSSLHFRQKIHWGSFEESAQ